MPSTPLGFVSEDGKRSELAAHEISALTPLKELHTFDEHYNRRKRFRAFALAPVLAKVFAGRDLSTLALLLRASDGYVVPLSAKALIDGGAHVAIDDLDVPGFEPIGAKRANPGPYYLVWPDAPDGSPRALSEFPRPYMLDAIAIATYESQFPKTVPKAPSPAAARGFATFKTLCVHCHAVNREGGRVGPELNVPKNVTEYWQPAQIKAYVKDPLSFRYGNMPANPQLSDADLDDVLAYLTLMKDQKQP